MHAWSFLQTNKLAASVRSVCRSFSNNVAYNCISLLVQHIFEEVPTCQMFAQLHQSQGKLFVQITEHFLSTKYLQYPLT